MAGNLILKRWILPPAAFRLVDDFANEAKYSATPFYTSAAHHIRTISPPKNATITPSFRTFFGDFACFLQSLGFVPLYILGVLTGSTWVAFVAAFKAIEKSTGSTAPFAQVRYISSVLLWL